MKRLYRHPYPCEYRPRFSSQHDAWVFVDEYKQDGEIKNCSHLRVDPFSDGFHATEYGPECAKDSFKVEDHSFDRDPQYLFYGCPKDCRLYEPAWKGKAKKSLKALSRNIRGFGNWILELVRAFGGWFK